jgi:ribonucleotide reductase beta subunit family protein with ferritin-like domain
MKLQNRLSEEKVMEIVREAVDLETEFICDALPCDLLGMNSRHMTEYIQFCANRLIRSIGYSKPYPNATNKFPWMELLSVDGKSNFFERRETGYSLPNLVRSFSTEEDF